MEGAALDNLGLAYMDIGKVNDAITYHNLCLKIVREMSYRIGESNTLGRIGVAYEALGDLKKAKEYYEKHLSMSRDLAYKVGEGIALVNLGTVCYIEGNLSEALKFCNEALNLAKEIDYRDLEGVVLRELAKVHYALELSVKAELNYAASLAVFKETDNSSQGALTCWDYGQFLVQQGVHERGIALMAESVAYEQQIGHVKAAEHAALVEQLRIGGELPPPPYASGSARTT